MAKVLVTGASGLLGSNAILELAQEHQVVGVYNQHRIRADGAKCLQADISEPGAAINLFEQELPDWVLHCAAAANVDACERDPAMAFRLNRDMAGYVAQAAAQVNAKLVHVSTDLVFDGVRGNYTETDTPNPINVYGQSKLEGEEVVLKYCADAIIVRTNIYGWNARDKTSLAEWFLGRLRLSQNAPGFMDMYSSPILVNHLVLAIVELWGRNLQGIFHIGGDGCISKYEFGCDIARLYGFDPEKISPSSWRNHGLYAPRAENLCLNISKVKRVLRIKLLSIESGLAAWKALESNGFLKRLKAMAAETESDSHVAGDAQK